MLKAQQVDKLTGDTRRPDLGHSPIFRLRNHRFCSIFGQIGQNSAPEAPSELFFGLSILISPPLSVSGHQEARSMARSRDRPSQKKGVFRYFLVRDGSSSGPGLCKTGPNPDPGDGKKTPCLSIDGLLVTRTPQETPRRPPEMRLEIPCFLSKGGKKQ